MRKTIIQPLPMSSYRDPLEIMLARERKTCKGCRHLIFAFEKAGCARGRKTLARCKFYTEKE